jgi:hypothetical protein
VSFWARFDLIRGYVYAEKWAVRPDRFPEVSFWARIDLIRGYIYAEK